MYFIKKTKLINSNFRDSLIDMKKMKPLIASDHNAKKQQ